MTSVLSKARLIASDGAADSEFGFSVAINSSGNIIAVGAPAANSFQGAVYVFVEPASGGWKNAIQTTKLTVPTQPQGELGDSIAISGNGDTIIAGATAATVNGNQDQGAAYVFTAKGGNWANGGTPTAELIASDSFSYFGNSIAISPNGATIAIGGVNYSAGELQDQGAVYVFTGPFSGTMTQTARLTASDAVNNQNLGSGVSISGNTIAAGAWDYAEGNGGPGAVYVFTKTGSTWTNMTQTAELTASDGLPLDTLGESVSISGNTIVAGAPGKKVGSNAGQGALYVFIGPPTGWVNSFQTAELTASNGVADASLGESVSIAGSFIVGGAICQQVANFCQGEVYAYVKPSTGWVNGTESYDLTAKGGVAGDELGWSTSLTATGPIAVSSALGYKSYIGAVYVF